jgi:hypothetical protein
MEISGFFDVVNNYQSSSDDKAEFGLGQAEVDIESELNDRVSTAVAIAYNADESTFELGAAEIGVNLYSDEETFLSSFDVTAGQFDVPFGIDLNWYPSIDRKLVTGPAVVDLTHGGWNDFGVRFEAASASGNITAYWVNGFEYPVMANADNVDILLEKVGLSVALGDEVDVPPTNMFGTRLGLTPVPGFELGGSVAMGINDENIDNVNLYGGDIQYSFANLNLKGEYIARTVGDNDINGYYVQPTLNISSAFVTGRYGSWSFGDDWTPRISLGAGYSIMDAAEIRFETTIEDNSDDNLSFVQFAAGF